MPTDMLDRLQENKLRGLEDLIDSWQAAAAMGGGEDEAAATAHFIVDEGIGLRQGLMRHWDYYWTAALSGKIPERQRLGAKLQSLLERGAGVLSRGAAVGRDCVDLSGPEVARLLQFEEQAKAFRLWVEECMARWDLLDRPRKPLNRERIAGSQAAFARGECEPVADILTRLEQGGLLDKE